MNTSIINKQRGFTLVEIAIVLVIIGLLLGGILKGQELINSARVRNLADQNAGVQAAYYGFIDRYRQVPGDFPEAAADTAIGQDINLPSSGAATIGNGRIDNNLEEAAAVWEQLAKSNFIGGGFTPATAVPADESEYIDAAPKNAFNGALTLTRNDGYEDASPSVRLILHLGPNIPVTIARELDVKVDDGKPTSGVLRVSDVDSDGTFPTLHAALAACIDTTGATDEYDITADAQDCGVAFLY